MQFSSRMFLAAAAASVAMVGSAHATLIASESFTGTDFAANTGTGWAGGWYSSAGQPLTTTQVTGLTNSYVASEGGAMNTGGKTIFRDLSAPLSGDFYVSMLIDSSGANYDSLAFFAGVANEYFGMGGVWNGGGLSSNVGSWVQQSAGTGGWGVYTGSTTALAGSSHLLVAHVTNFVDGQSASVNVYVDPDLSGDTLPVTSSYSFNLNASLAPITALRAEQAGSASIDEIRIGTELSDVVTVVPEPASLGLLGLASTLLMRRRASR